MHLNFSSININSKIESSLIMNLANKLNWLFILFYLSKYLIQEIMWTLNETSSSECKLLQNKIVIFFVHLYFLYLFPPKYLRCFVLDSNINPW